MHLLCIIFQGCCSDPNGQCVPPGKDTVEYFNLKDLWDCYYDWSAYGVGTPMMFENGDTMQYHVPYLSAIQIYSSKAVAAASRYAETTQLCLCTEYFKKNGVSHLIVVYIGLGERTVKELNLIPGVRTVEVISYLEHWVTILAKHGMLLL